MKLSIILPACDVPLGSGRAGPWLRNALQTVQEGGYADFECLVGCDGDIPAIRSAVEAMHDDRFRYIPLPCTHSWGNYQRNVITQEHATGDYVAFMDHDDGYVPGALKVIADEIETFPGRGFFFRARLSCGVVVWAKPSITHSASLAGHGTIVPRGTGWPVWGSSASRSEDHNYMLAVNAYADSIGKPMVWCSQIVARIRPWAPQEVVPWIGVGTELATG